jgi:hypothetical protein
MVDNEIMEHLKKATIPELKVLKEFVDRRLKTEIVCALSVGQKVSFTARRGELVKGSVVKYFPKMLLLKTTRLV